MIYTHIAYAPIECEKNIGCAYNKFMEILPNDDDWACFLDHDAMFTTYDWYNQLGEIIRCNPDVGAFGARTNRLNSTYQLVGNIDVYNHDITYHRKIGKHLQTKYYDDLFLIDKKTAQKEFSGVLILLKKSIWKKIKGFKTDGFNHVDNDLRYRLEQHKIPFHIMNGVYVYHWYKADDPYERCRKKFKAINERYEKENKDNFDLNNIFLYKGTNEELPI
jgi:hypothetical protein